jgi:hypothetical protein
MTDLPPRRKWDESSWLAFAFIMLVITVVGVIVLILFRLH